tara:strand:+ start:514 stop:2052 length:1539 start_codon:yes stop_codon:yes gene_type:complete
MKQTELITRLAGGEAFGGREPERIDTHISVVFLTPDRAYKLKRALSTGYLDFTGLDDRKRGCEREIALNRRTAPEIYLRAVPLSFDTQGRLTIDGDGEPLEWLVEMKRFDPRATFDVLASSNDLDDALLVELADQIADFHKTADVVDRSDFASMFNDVIAGNRDELGASREGFFDAAEIEALTGRQLKLSRDLSPAITRRERDGRVRECHGDLHLGNICLFDGQPRIFDAIEFNEDFNRIDTLYDLGFLLMDLAARGYGRGANIVFNRYMYRLPDIAGLRVLPLFLSVRATIRAHVMAKSADQQSEPADRDRSLDLARVYFRMAGTFMDDTEPRLIAVGGYSGTGKTTMANRIASAVGASPGALVLSSDLLRKRRFAVEPDERLDPRMYSDDVSREIYAGMSDLAGEALSEGRSVVVDATFIDERSRIAIEHVASEKSVPFNGYWLTGDPEELARRIADRPQGASDATQTVLERQLERGPGDLRWRSIDTTAPGDGGLEAVRDDLGLPAQTL